MIYNIALGKVYSLCVHSLRFLPTVEDMVQVYAL